MASPGSNASSPGSKTLDIETTQILRNRIHDTFINCVVPSNVLHKFRIHKNKTLTDIDISEIEAMSTNRGPLIGAQLLLDRLKNYPDWFSTLLQVLRDSDVNLPHIACKFETYLDEACAERMNQSIAVQHNATLERNESSTSLGSPQQEGNNLNFNCPVTTEDDFDLDVDGNATQSQGGDSLMSDMPYTGTEKDAERSVPDRAGAADETLVKQTVALSLGADAPPKPSRQEKIPFVDEDGYTNPVDPSDCGHGLMESPTPLPKEEPEYDCLYEDDGTLAFHGARKKTTTQVTSMYEKVSCRGPCVRQSSQVPKSKSSEGNKKRVGSEFSYAETQEALCHFAGWHSIQTDKQIIETFKEILEKKKNGHYLLWFWGKKKRPAICVSHSGKLITFIVHRRADKTNPQRFVYYIIDSTMSKSTLPELINYHLQNGLNNMTRGSPADEKILLSQPILERVDLKKDPNFKHSL